MQDFPSFADKIEFGCKRNKYEIPGRTDMHRLYFVYCDITEKMLCLEGVDHKDVLIYGHINGLSRKILSENGVPRRLRELFEEAQVPLIKEHNIKERI